MPPETILIDNPADCSCASERANGLALATPKRAWSDGTTAQELSRLELV